MASVEAVQPAYQIPGTPEWAERTIRWTYNTVRTIHGQAEPLAAKIPLLKNYAAAHGEDWPSFARKSFGYDAAYFDKIVEGVDILTARGRTNVTVGEAVDAHDQVTKTFAAAEPTKAVGGARPNAGRKPKDQPKESKLSDNHDSPARGTSPEYLAGRIKAKAATSAQAAEVASKVERGEYSSMRAAARDAGVLKPVDPVKTATCALEKVPFQRLAELVARLPDNVRRTLRMILNDDAGGR